MNGERRFRRFHSDTRTSENFTLKGLQSLTGQPKNNWLEYLSKEIIDNSLEACDKPEIVIKVDDSDDSYKISFRDNGQGISKKVMEKIFDIERFGGTKRHYKLLTRGVQGNALMTVLGIQKILGYPLQIQSQNTLYTIDVVQNDLLGQYEIKIDRKKVENNGGLSIFLSIPPEAYVGDIDDMKNVFVNFIELNPQANLSFFTPDGNYIFKGNGYGNNRLDLGRNATTGKVIWFAKNDFFDRLRADARINPEMSVKNFIGEFYGLSSTKKISDVIKYFNNEEIDKIGDFFSDSKIKEKDATALYDSMCHKTKAFSERSLRKTLGCIGKKGMTHSLLESLKMTKQYESVEEIVDLSRERDLKIQNINDLIVYYSKGGVTKTDKVIPFFFEMITIPLSGKKQEWNCSNNVTFGINQSFIYSLPEIWLFFNRRGGKSEESHNGIKQSFRFNYNFKIICNLTCPTIDFQDKGKQLFDTEPFSDAIAEVVGKTIRKITNEIIPTLNKLNKPEETTPDDIYGKAPKGFIKDFVFRTFESIYNEATDNGTFTITQRQLFYAMRPVFHNTIKRYGYRYTWDSNHYKEKKLELEYKTFCGYVDDYEVNVLAKRIIYKKHRGFFVEPHSNRHVNLGTRDVKEYNPDLKQYNNLLFVEKSGFYELLHNDFQLTKRYDIGLINSEGYATNAIRDLIEKIQRKKPGIKLYVLTDFDIDGLGIARNIKKAEELSAIDVFDCKRIGITFDDIGKYNLQAEPVDYPMSKMTELNNQYINDRVSDDVYNFLKEGQRIEINALTPVELKEYLEDKFEELEIEKLKPESKDDVKTFEVESVDDVKRDAIKEAIADFVIDKCGYGLYEAVKDAITFRGEEKDAEKELEEITDNQSKMIFDEIIDELKDFPPKNWLMINDKKVEEKEKESGEIIDEFKDMVNEKVREFLKEKVSIKVEVK